MMTFWLIAAVFVAIALAFVLPTLLQRDVTESNTGDKEANVEVYRDQLSELDADMQNGIIGAEQYQQDRDEIERRLLSDVSASGKPGKADSKPVHAGHGAAYALAFSIPIIAIGFYFRIGNPDAISISGAASAPATSIAARGRQAPLADGPQASQQGADGPMTQERMEANMAALAKRLEQNPGDVQGWRMLARSYSALQKYDESSKAYARATALKTDDADLWADYALAMTMANGQQVQGQPLELVNKALKLDPDNPKALQLAGGAAYQAKRYKEAMAYWQRVLKTLPPDSELAQALSRKINEAKSLASNEEK